MLVVSRCGKSSDLFRDGIYKGGNGFWCKYIWMKSLEFSICNAVRLWIIHAYLCKVRMYGNLDVTYSGYVIEE